MVPSQVPSAGSYPVVTKRVRSRAHDKRRRVRSIIAVTGDGGAVDAQAAGRQQQRRRRRRQQQQQHRRRRSRKNNNNNNNNNNNHSADVVVDNRTRIKRRVKYLLLKMRVDQNLLDAYSGEGWKGQSREKIRPEQELQRAEAQILHSKLAIREAIHELDNLGLEGSLEKNAFDAEGRVYHEEIFCAKCKSQEALLDNDIILCDGACNRGFHQYCLDPPLATINIPPGDEGWLCPVCECKLECVEVINAYLNTNFEVENSWEMFFDMEALIAAGGGTEAGADGDLLPSSDSEDDDYDPGGMEMRATSESEGESSEGREDREDSDSGSDSRGLETSASDKNKLDRSDASNLLRLADVGKRRSSSKKGSGGSHIFISDDSDVSLVDESNDGDVRPGGSQAELSLSDDEAMVIGGKRHRKAVDYKRLHDEMFGNAGFDYDIFASEDEDWGPQRRRRRTIPEDPSKPRRPRIRRRRISSLYAANGQGEGDEQGEKRLWRRLPDSAVEALRLVGAVDTLPSKSRKEELATELGLSYDQVHGWFKNQRRQALRKGLVSSKRPHLVASSSQGGDAQSNQDDTVFLNENNPNAYLAEKLDEIQLRLVELKKTLEEFARNNTAVEDDDDRSGEVDNNFGNGGIGLPANGRRIVYVPVAKGRERPPMIARTSAR